MKKIKINQSTFFFRGSNFERSHSNWPAVPVQATTTEPRNMPNSCSESPASWTSACLSMLWPNMTGLIPAWWSLKTGEWRTPNFGVSEDTSESVWLGKPKTQCSNNFQEESGGIRRTSLNRPRFDEKLVAQALRIDNGAQSSVHHRVRWNFRNSV